ncbi:MAG: hypothetical protein F4206_07955 [Gammaproteobacteria bacterium]|nr:hypothetical protein [Boseongicola sp. SB0665_bin_10]MYG66648.1 hypothetical protein [Gammaproteobacteria bacterium]
MIFIDWAGKLPDPWEAKPLRSVADYTVSNVDKLVSKDEAPIRLCNYTDVYHNEYITLDLEFMRATASQDEIARFGLSVDDVVITKDSESWDDIGVPALVRETADDLVCGYHLALLRPRKHVMDGSFLFRCLQAEPVRLQLELSANGVTRFGLSKSEIGSTTLPVPPLPQQRAIAEYLDRETARLDGLVAAKEHVLELLAEKRQALIVRAVTRGIDPDVSYRDSGVSWLGDIPAHWKIVDLRFLVDMIGGATPATARTEYWDGDTPWVSPKDMKQDEISNTGDCVSALALSETALRLIPEKAVLVVVRGMILAHSFPVAVTTGPVTINQDMKALLCRDILDPLFLCDFLRASKNYFVSMIDSAAHGTKKLEARVLGNLQVPLPPLGEQRQISDRIASDISDLDLFRTTTERAMDLLKERRAVLIFEAVTGRVDVESAT